MKTKFKSGIIVAVLLFLLVGLSACSGVSNSQKKNRVSDNINLNQKKENITINMQGHWKGEDLRENYVLETIKEFELRHPGIKVNLKWNADFPNGRTGALESTINQFKLGDIDWDIIWLEPFYYQEIAAALNDQNWGENNLVDFESIPGFVESQQSFIINDSQYRDHMNGMITGPYIEGFYQPFFYNQELTKMMGIEVKSKGMTFDDLLGYFKAVSDYNKKNNTNYAILYDSGDYKGGIGYAPSVWNIFQSLFRSEFSNLDDIKNLETSPEKLKAIRKVLDSIEQLSVYKPLIAGWEDLPWFDTRDYVLNNKTVFTVAGASWMYSHWHGIDAEKSLKMVPVEMPMYQPVTHYMGGYNPMFAVAKKSEVKDEATSLLMDFSTSIAAEKWIKYAKAPSGIKGGLSQAGSASSQLNQYDDFITYISNTYGGNVYDSKTVDYVLGEKYKSLTLEFNKHIAAVMDGKISADEAYNLILSDMDKIDKK